ncbi:hypothetical protein DICPUDRAFT_148837 [Dictyostelium purpureum]|uniref:Oxysterol binding protein n=1 Tax=Dictyostelium purpureum TaxID=5786 RepID=F0ZC50_DICPU|nr:uncharacterized protein DICPUDRAFT_148837 [Dictyostelium purpureum]EGC38462.1 hypothetical protein DICPUDRAFT_148837 [Dictyostelium purpureum]|eukprot:XP_003285020.1 hypothetical protein DICPUDRAFT_148837 [Dictyostelium purpureum]
MSKDTEIYKIDDASEEKTFEEGKDESRLQIVFRFIKSFNLKLGANINKAPIPVSFLSPKSTIYNYLEGYYSNFDILLNLNNIEDSLERSIQVYRWILSSFSHTSVFGKPVVPILGETLMGNFHCKDENGQIETENYYCTECISEETETATGCIYNKKHGIKVNYLYTVNYYFMGTNIKVELVGYLKVKIDKYNETYSCPPPLLCARFLRGFSEIVGETTITSDKSKYKLQLKYFEKPLFGGDYDKAEVQVIDTETNQATHLIQGKWSNDFKIQDLKTKETKPLFQRPAATSIVQLNQDKELPSDSSNIWKDFTDAHNEGNNSKKFNEKKKLEKQQKQLLDDRKKNNIVWEPKHFVQNKEKEWDLVNY